MKWQDYDLYRDVDTTISRIEMSKENDLIIVLKLPISKDTIIIDLNEKQIRYTCNNSAHYQDSQTLLGLLDIFITEIIQEKNKLDIELKEHKQKIDGAVSKSELESLLAIDQACHYLQESLDNLKKIIEFLDKKSIYLKDYEHLNLVIEIDQLSFNLDTIMTQVNTLTEISDLIYSQKQNNYVKRLTILALLFSIPTFITSFYGMNITLPFQSHPYLMWILLIINMILTMITLFIIKKIE